MRLFGAISRTEGNEINVSGISQEKPQFLHTLAVFPVLTSVAYLDSVITIHWAALHWVEHREQHGKDADGEGKTKDDNPWCFGTYPEKP